MGKDMHARSVDRIAFGLEAQGASIKQIKDGGYRINFPNGTSTVLHRTISDVRAILNFKADVKRGGLEWPLAKGFKRKKQSP